MYVLSSLKEVQSYAEDELFDCLKISHIAQTRRMFACEVFSGHLLALSDKKTSNCADSLFFVCCFRVNTKIFTFEDKSVLSKEW